MAKPSLTAARLRELLHYEPETGVFTWTQNRYRVFKGDVAGNHGVQGYTIIGIERRTYRAHRLAWLYVHGDWPAADIDHLNGVRHDNRLSNLRDVDRRTNLQNLNRAKRQNKSGFLGVCCDKNQKQGKRWIAQIKAEGSPRVLGYFETPEEAQQAYLNAKRQHHKGCTI